MQYAIISFTLTAIVTAQIDEFMSPDSYITDVKDLDDLTKAIRASASLVYDDHLSYDVANIDNPINDFNSQTQSTTTNTMSTVNDKTLPSLRELVSKDIVKDNKHAQDEVIPALISLQQVISSDVQSTTTTVDDFVADTKVIAMADIEFDEITNIETKIVPTLKSLQQVTNLRTTAVDDKIVVDTKVTKMADIQFDEIKNVKTKIEESTTTSKPDKATETTTVENSSDKKILVSKFLKVDEINGDITFSLVNEASDLTQSNSRKVFFAKPVVSNGTDSIAMTGELNKPHINQGSMSEEDYIPKDFSKSTFVGVPMSMLLPMLRSKTKSEGDSKYIPSIGKALQMSHGLPSSVVGYIKDNARSIGDIVFGGGR